MGFPILVRLHFYIESGPTLLWDLASWITMYCARSSDALKSTIFANPFVILQGRKRLSIANSIWIDSVTNLVQLDIRHGIHCFALTSIKSLTYTSAFVYNMYRLLLVFNTQVESIIFSKEICWINVILMFRLCCLTCLTCDTTFDKSKVDRYVDVLRGRSNLFSID